MVASPFQMSFLLLIRVSGPGLLFLPSSTPPGRVGGCCPCHKPMEWHVVPSGSVQLLSGHILRGFIYPHAAVVGCWKKGCFIWQSSAWERWMRNTEEGRATHLVHWKMDEKHRGRKGHPLGPLEATVRMSSCSTCTSSLKHQESESLCSFSPGTWTPSFLFSTLSQLLGSLTIVDSVHGVTESWTRLSD